MRLFLLLLLALAAACGRPDPPPLEETTSAPEPDGIEVEPPPSATPPAPSDLDAVQDTLTTDRLGARQPGEILRLDPSLVLGATIERGGQRYDVRRQPEPQLNTGGGIEPASASAIDAWLARFAPLEAESRLSDLDPRAVRERATHRIDFQFEDDTARSVLFLREGGRLAVVSQVDGPVFSLPPGRLDDLVPPAGALR